MFPNTTHRMTNKKPGDTGRSTLTAGGNPTFTDKNKRSPVPKWTKDMNKQCPKMRSRQTRIWEGVRIPKQLTKYKLQQQCNLTSRCNGSVGQDTGAGHRPAGTVLREQAATAEDTQAHGGPALVPVHTRMCSSPAMGRLEPKGHWLDCTRGPHATGSRQGKKCPSRQEDT